MSDKRVALVTGANRGIGLEVCRQLAQKDLKVILTSRSKEKGQSAVESFVSKGLDIAFLPLDVIDQKSVHDCINAVSDQYGRCDVLVNNAGVFPDKGFPSVFESDVQTVRTAMETNVYGPLSLCQAVVPLMKKNNYGRIVNLSSGMGQLTHMNGGCPGYRISKTSINALTRILADELKATNIKVNSMCPGWVKTEMGGPNATRSVEEGADTAVWLATLDDDGPSGGFFRDRKPFAW